MDEPAIRAALEAELVGLAEASAAAADERRPVALDQQSVGRLSRMNALQLQAMAKAVEGRRQGREARIRAALGRLDAGEYGFCLGCGDDILAARLAIDPTIARCVACST